MQPRTIDLEPVFPRLSPSTSPATATFANETEAPSAQGARPSSHKVDETEPGSPPPLPSFGKTGHRNPLDTTPPPIPRPVRSTSTDHENYRQAGEREFDARLRLIASDEGMTAGQQEENVGEELRQSIAMKNHWLAHIAARSGAKFGKTAAIITGLLALVSLATPIALSYALDLGTALAVTSIALGALIALTFFVPLAVLTWTNRLPQAQLDFEGAAHLPRLRER